MIKSLLMNQSIDLNKILLNNYVKLGLNEEETICLMHLFALQVKGKNALSYAAIKGKMSLNQKDIAGVLNSLVSKNFMDIKMEAMKTGREQECFDLTPTFNKIEQLFLQSVEEEKITNALKMISSYIELFERELGRSLAPVEIDIIEKLAQKFSLDEVRNAVIEAAKIGKINVKQIETILYVNEISEGKVDEEYANAIRDFYHRINK